MMRIDSAMTTGVQGFQRAEQLAAQASGQIAPPAGERVELPEELANLKVAELQAGASAKVIQTASDMMGTLIDIRV